MKTRIQRTRSGTYDIRLPKRERQLIASLVPQLRELLTGVPDDPSLARLWPPAYGDDEARTDEYWSLMRDDLLEERLAALDTVEETLDATSLTEEQLSEWMGAVNCIRLVLGTRLDITEDADRDAFDPQDPRTPAFAVYDYLTWLLGQIVEALSTSIE